MNDYLPEKAPTFRVTTTRATTTTTPFSELPFSPSAHSPPSAPSAPSAPSPSGGGGGGFCLGTTCNDTFCKILTNLDVPTLCGTFRVNSRFQKYGNFVLSRTEEFHHDRPSSSSSSSSQRLCSPRVINKLLHRVIEECPKLKEVHLNGIGGVSYKTIIKILQTCTKLTTFSVHSTICYLSNIAQNIPNITTLCQHGAITERGIKKLSLSCQRLEHLDLAKSHWSQEAQAESMPRLLERNCESLKTLKLMRFSRLAEMLQSIGKIFVNLTHVSLANCGLYRNDCIVLATYIPNVQYLDLSMNLSLMNDDLIALSDAKLNLVELNVCWTNIKSEALIMVFRNPNTFPNLRCLGVSVPFQGVSCIRDHESVERLEEVMTDLRPNCAVKRERFAGGEWTVY